MAHPDLSSGIRPLRVLRVIASLDPAVGGPAESSANSCIAAQRAGVETTVLVPVRHQETERVEPVIERLRDEGVRVHTFSLTPERSYYAHRWAISPRLTVWIVRHLRAYDLLHVHAVWGLSQVCGLLIAAALRRPCVVTPHEGLTSFDLKESRHRVRSIAKRIVKDVYLRLTALVVFSSALEARDSLPSDSAVQAVVLPHPLRDALEVPQTVTHRRPSCVQIGFLGRLHEKKNLDVLLRAMSALANEARLVIAGDGPAFYREHLRELATNLEISERVDWLGFIDGGRRWSFLDEIDILAMPSRYECFGMVAAEAMARGTATVVSRNTGIAELIEQSKGGLIAPPTVSGFSQALAQLVNRPAHLAEVARRGAAAARDSLSLEAHGQALQRHYEALLPTTT